MSSTGAVGARFLRRGAVIGAAMMLALTAVAPAASETVKIGMILTYSGRDAALGEQIDRAVDLYVKLHEEDLPPGVKVELIKRDDSGVNPDLAKRLAQELVLRDHVQILTGGQWTPNAMAVAALSKQAKVPFVTMTAGGSAVTLQSPYVVRTGWTLWQTSYPLGVWASKQGWKNAYTVVSDFTPGHDGEAAFIKGFTEGGGTITGSVRIALKTTDYLPYFQKVKDANPDVIYVFNPGGPQATAFMKAFDDVGIVKSKIKLIGPADVTYDDELPNMGRSALGVVTLGQYSPAATRQSNLDFVAAWKKEYGAESVPTFFAMAGWDGMHAIFDAIIAQKGKINSDATMKFLRTWSDPNSPRGPIRIDQAGDLVQNLYLRRVEDKDGLLANVEFETVGQFGDPWKTFNK
ncbi:MAG: ABC transporter substrate-binding protein [Sulfuritalea sp.]|nr:ABC transporter substrate-binding protein [Sulfuritalea sp.]